ncbi:TPA: cupin-like domain-containing protein [Yersinia enterocolitica]|nr:cupin-like domain-containing protein [Yersinia enterocolitica]HDL7431929.1 cupin-like domain-containing protein [Yersinia enterocolitica]HDL7474374.1 cupin-like domain-containing protein [Yersinia enterocolitica]
MNILTCETGKVKYNLSCFLNGILNENFFNCYYEKKPYHATGIDVFGVFITNSFFNELLCHNKKITNLYLVENGVEIKRGEYVDIDNELNVEKTLELHQSGATVVVNDFHNYDESVLLLNSYFQNLFNSPCGINLYLTPKNQKGFNAHFDPHDVFIFQLKGTKQWKIYEAAINLPLKSQEYTIRNHDLRGLTLEKEMKKGDLLYIPRGWVHEAITVNETSVHITLGVFSFTRADVLLEILSEHILSDASFRKSFPPCAQTESESIDGLSNVMLKLLKKISEGDIIDQVVKRYTKRFNV